MSLKRRIIFIVFNQFELLDLSGPSSVFDAANQLAKDKIYESHLLSSSGGLIRSCCGIEVNTAEVVDFDVLCTDTILIVGGGRDAVDKASNDQKLKSWLLDCYKNAERIASVCSGSFILASFGLLNGICATTHWAELDRLQNKYPFIKAEQGALYTKDNNVWTSAGVTAGIDMSLAIVGHDHNPALIYDIARWLLVYVHRPGNQSQFSELLNTQRNEEFKGLVLWLDQNLSKQIRVSDMADYVSMTERTFYRKFIDSVGITPSKFLEIRRLFRGKYLLENGHAVKSVHLEVGYKSQLGFRLAFEEYYGMSPSKHKRMHGKLT